MTRFIRRFFGALALLPYVYEEVEADRRALPQALAIVLLSSLASGASYWNDLGAAGVASASAAATFGWLAWTWLVYHIGTRWLPGDATQADWGELLRTTGFATAPGVLRILGLVPEIRDAVFWLTSVWILAAFVLAVRQALDYEKTWRALVVCLAGWVVYAGLLFLLPQACELGSSLPRRVYPGASGKPTLARETLITGY